MTNRIEVKQITKKYCNITAVDNVSFTVGEGEIFGLIGPDGSGKTSIFRILTTLLLADKGSGSICGYDLVKNYENIRRIVGYMPGSFSLYQDLTVEENLKLFATIFNTTLENNYDVIKDIYQHIEPFRKRQVSKLSGGMKQKLALCCALVHSPEVLFLDEPTTGVDPVSRVEFWNMLERLKCQGISILVSTPYMDEAARCDRILLLKEGKTLAINSPSGLFSEYKERLYSVQGENMYMLLKLIRQWHGTKTCFAFGDFHHLTIHSNVNIEDLIVFLRQKGSDIPCVQNIKPTIEDCFMALI